MRNVDWATFSPPNLSITGPVLVATLVVYLAYVHHARFRRIHALHATYAKKHGLATPPPLQRKEGKAPTRDEYPMTPAEAQEIVRLSWASDMPYLLGKALEFALFKTYGIPSISRLLLSTTEFKASDKAGRRYVDTAVLIFGFLSYPLRGPGSGSSITDEPEDPRGALAIARMNWLHARYQGKISNDDFLFTLSTFILEPQVWASKYEWRSLTPLEEQAWFVFFSEIGRRMGIQGIPTELQDLVDWAETYEAEHMLPEACCRDVAAATTLLLLHNVPQAARALGTKIVSCLLYDRLREAIMLPAPPPLLKSILTSTLVIRGFLIRHFFLPRSRRNDVILLPDVKDSPAFPKGYTKDTNAVSTEKASGALPFNGTAHPTKAEQDEMLAPRMHPKIYYSEAWQVHPPLYMPTPTGLSALRQSLLLALGLAREDQLPGPRYKPEGFRFEEIGPVKLEQKGHEEVKQLAEAIHGGPLKGLYAVGGMPVGRCPFGSGT